MKVTRERGVHLSVGVYLTPWLVDVTVGGEASNFSTSEEIRSRELVFMFGPWRWATEIVRLFPENEEL